MAPYVSVPMPVHDDTSTYVKLYMPIDVLNHIKNGKWRFWPSEADAFPEGFDARFASPNEIEHNSLRNRASLHNGVKETESKWDFRLCSQFSEVVV